MLSRLNALAEPDMDTCLSEMLKVARNPLLHSADIISAALEGKQSAKTAAAIPANPLFTS